MPPASAVGASLLGAFLLAAALGTAALEIPRFTDPCHTWGAGREGDGNHTTRLEPGGTCQGVTGTSETREEAASRLLVIQGTGAVAGALAIVGGWRRRPLPLAAASGLCLLLSVPLAIGSGWILTLAVAAAFLWAARDLPPWSPLVTALARAVGTAAGFLLALLLFSIGLGAAREGVFPLLYLPFAAIQLGLLALVVAGGWRRSGATAA